MFGMSDDYKYPDALDQGPSIRGRGAGLNPGNRFESVRLHVLGEHLDHMAVESDGPAGTVTTKVYRDHTKKIINRVDSPDIGFNWSINPYRGCEHGCVYCYARPFHELLGFSSGLDFETKIVAKFDAAQMLRKELARPSWKGETIAMSGVTDCYQPIESKLRITRRCLEVLAECRQPVAIVTKNRLVLRDIDLLRDLARHNAVRVAMSVTSLDPHLAAKMEPRASSPADRLHTVRELSRAGVPVSVMMAPIIPGLNDREIPQLLEAASGAGALSAHYVMLRLPYQVKSMFLDWLGRHFPDRAKHVESLLRSTRGGKLYEAAFGRRMKGHGVFAQQIAQLFKVSARRYGLDGQRSRLEPMAAAGFRRPTIGGQMVLF